MIKTQNPWSLPQSSHKAQSLTEIMSEQLVENIQNEENQLLSPPSNTNNLNKLNNTNNNNTTTTTETSETEQTNLELDPDYEFALKLQRELDEQAQGQASSKAPEQQKETLSKDHRYAKLLQAELNADIPQSLASKPQSNVGLFRGSESSFFEYKRYTSPYVLNENESWDELDEDEEDDFEDPLFDEDEEDELFDEEQEDEYQDEQQTQAKFGLAPKGHHAAIKLQGRLSTGKFVTKHDPTLNNKRNAALLEERGFSGNMKNIQISTEVFNDLKQNVAKTKACQTRVRGNRLDVSTAEKVLDQRTRVLLLKMMNQDILRQFYGVIATGKESHVYSAHAGIGLSTDLKFDLEDEEDEAPLEEEQQQEEEEQKSHTKLNRSKIPERKEKQKKAPKFVPVGEGTELAVKIFKTTLNEFKNRTQYLEDEHRFRNKTKSQNQRFIKVWAEKEFRNLKKMTKAGVPCPTPFAIKEHVLLMQFLGDESAPAPRLKDAAVGEKTFGTLYLQAILLLRKMWQDCKMVHGDFSEFNLLLWNNQLHVIDVSQAVDRDHPSAMDFLRRDINSINLFFSKKVPAVLPVKRVFSLVTDPVDSSSLAPEAFAQLLKKAAAVPLTDQERQEEEVFKSVTLSSSLKQMGNNFSKEPILQLHGIRPLSTNSDSEDSQSEEDDLNKND